jgi:hypothetical protein
MIIHHVQILKVDWAHWGNVPSKPNHKSTGWGEDRMVGTVFDFAHDDALEDAIGSHAYSFDANVRVINSTPLGYPDSYDLFLPIATLKVELVCSMRNALVEMVRHKSRMCTSTLLSFLIDRNVHSRLPSKSHLCSA